MDDVMFETGIPRNLDVIKGHSYPYWYRRPGARAPSTARSLLRFGDLQVC